MINRLKIAKPGSMKQVKQCLQCCSPNLAPINFSANECLECGYQQADRMPVRGVLPVKALRG